MNCSYPLKLIVRLLTFLFGTGLSLYYGENLQTQEIYNTYKTKAKSKLCYRESVLQNSPEGPLIIELEAVEGSFFSLSNRFLNFPFLFLGVGVVT